jgi:hypothetical protein
VRVFYKAVSFLVSVAVKLQPMKKTLGMQEILLEIDQQKSASTKIQGVQNRNTPSKDLLAQERQG